MSTVAKNRLKSTWTPLSNDEANSKIFEERRVLVGKWFDKWNGQQRKKVLAELLSKSKIKQMEFASNIIQKKVPVYHEDFTRRLPRVISLYLFSYLDPRSLSRCAQVCWYWKMLTELDQLWMIKCIRLGWQLSFVPSPYETGVWKRHYVENIRSLQYLRPKVEHVPKIRTPSQNQHSRTEYAPNGKKFSPPPYVNKQMAPPELPVDELTRLDMADGLDSNRSRKPPTPKRPGSKPQWKGPSPVPKDIWRYNHYDNENEIEKVNSLRKKGYYGAESEEVSRQARGKVKTGKVKRSSSLSRLASESQMSLGDIRPDWAKQTEGSPYIHTSNSGMGDGAMDASVRPSPVRPPRRRSPNRTSRDPPSTELFPDRPWQVPRHREDSDSDT